MKLPFPKKSSYFQRKGVYPNSYIDSSEKFKGTNLPAYGADWTNSLSGNNDITYFDYEYARMIWNEFRCQDIGDYHDLYLKSDVVLLADVFESFRNLFKKTYDLDPCHYYSAPNISWDAMLKTTKIELDLLSDIDILLFYEEAIRGGLNGIEEKIYLKTNDAYFPYFETDKPSTFGLFLDVVNLYGGTMMKPMPTGGFKWIEKSLEEFLATTDESKIGYFIMVDLKYSKELHDEHNGFPLASEKMKITNDSLSSYQKSFNQPENPTKKLMETLYDKQNYIFHYSLLKFFVEQGLQAENLNCVLQFDQSKFLKPYFEMNTKLCQQPGLSDFAKNFFKFLNNACFGKTMENL